jgi:NAD+ kinase
MWPDVEAILIVPLAAHALFARPLVVGPGSTVTVEVTTSSGAHGVVTTDGRRQVEAPPGTRITVRWGASPVLLARLNDAPFTDRLVRKFDLPVAGWRERAALRAGDAAAQDGTSAQDGTDGAGDTGTAGTAAGERRARG